MTPDGRDSGEELSDALSIDLPLATAFNKSLVNFAVPVRALLQKLVSEVGAHRLSFEFTM